MTGIIIAIIVAIIGAVGLALILMDRFKIPKYSVSKATHNLGKRQNQKTNPLEIWLKEIANWVSGKIRLNEYKRMQLEADLKTADMNTTPEMYVADNIVKSLFIGIFAILVFFFNKLIAGLIVLCAIILYVNNSKKVANRIRDKRKKIEYELPRLVATIEKTLTHNRDVLGILDAYGIATKKSGEQCSENLYLNGEHQFVGHIVGEEFELPKDKRERNTNTNAYNSEAIATIRNHIKCGCCGSPMVRRIATRNRIKESWVCANNECGMRVRMTDHALLEKLSILINRIIENQNLLMPKEKKISGETSQKIC